MGLEVKQSVVTSSRQEEVDTAEARLSSLVETTRPPAWLMATDVSERVPRPIMVTIRKTPSSETRLPKQSLKSSNTGLKARNCTTMSANFRRGPERDATMRRGREE